MCILNGKKLYAGKRGYGGKHVIMFASAKAHGFFCVLHFSGDQHALEPH